MLRLAYPYQDELNKAYQSTVFQDKYKYYNFSNWWNYTIKLENNSWNNIEMVSIKGKEILGYFNANISRCDNLVSALGVINFSTKGNIIFSKDFYKFIIDLFYKFNFRKIRFTVVVGNPIAKMYDRYIAKYGGRIIGISNNDALLQDGKYYNVKYYEIFQNDFKYNFKKKTKRDIKMKLIK